MDNWDVSLLISSNFFINYYLESINFNSFLVILLSGKYLYFVIRQAETLSWIELKWKIIDAIYHSFKRIASVFSFLVSVLKKEEWNVIILFRKGCWYFLGHLLFPVNNNKKTIFYFLRKISHVDGLRIGKCHAIAF